MKLSSLLVNLSSRPLLLSLVYFALPLGAEGSQPVLTPQWEQGRYSLGLHSEVLEDPTGTLSFEDVQKSTAFQKVNQEFPNYGFTGITYWFRFTLQSEAPTQLWYLTLESPTVDQVELHSPSVGENWEVLSTGDQVEFSKRPIKHRYFHFPLNSLKNEPQTYYLRLQTRGSSEFKILLQNSEYFFKEEHEGQFLQGIFVGLLMIMILYYGLLSIGSRSREYLSLTLFLGAFLLFKMSLSGLAFEYLWPNSPWMANRAISLFVPLVFAAATLNAYFFFPLRDTPRLLRIFQTLLFIQFFNVSISLFTPYSAVKYFTLVGVLTVPLITFSSIRFLMRGFTPARLYLLAWSSMLVGAAFMAGQKMGWIPISFFSIYGVELASALLVVFMSVGLSDKFHQANLAMRRAQTEQIKAETEARALTEKLNQSLEQQVRDRTQKIQQQSRELEILLKNLKQGICSVDAQGKIHAQYSPYLETLLSRSALEQESLFELLFSGSTLSPDEKELIQSAINLSVMQDRVNFELNSHLLPKTLTYQNTSGERRDFEIEWAAIEDNEARTLRVLTAIRDVTEIRKAQRLAQERSDELKAIGKVLDLPSTQFQRFLKSSTRLLATASAICNAVDSDNKKGELLRVLHTIKGNSRTYGLDDVASLAHEAESRVIAGENGLTKILELEGRVASYARIHTEKLKGGKIAQIEETLSSVTQFLMTNWDKLRLPEGPRSELFDLLEESKKWNTHTFKRTLEPLIRSLPLLSHDLGKAAPQVRIHGEDFLLPANGSETIEAAFVHLFRNSLDHGFAATSKNNEVIIQILRSPTGIGIQYRDSGRGLPIQILKEKAMSRGLISSNASAAEIAETIFSPGVSSANQLTEYSGRGVGMDAVREAFEQLNGNIQIHLENESDGYCRFAFEIHIPMTVAQNDDTQKAA